MSRNLINSVGVSTDALRKNENFSLEDYILQNKNIPIGLFGDNIIDAISIAINYLTNNGGGRVSIPADNSNFPLEIHVHKNRTNTYHTNFEYYYDRYPTVEPRPYTNEDWQLGDIIYSSNITTSKCLGWVCTEAGTPGKWTAFGWSRNWMSQCEVVDSLPDPSELQEGRSVITRDETTGKSLLHYCVKNENGTYEWINQYFSEEDIIDRIEEIISQMPITNADTLDNLHADDFIRHLGMVDDVEFLNNIQDYSYEAWISATTAESLGLPSEAHIFRSFKVKPEDTTTSSEDSTESGNEIIIDGSTGEGSTSAGGTTHNFQLAISEYGTTMSRRDVQGTMTGWGSWSNIANGCNADTVDDKHASDFAQMRGDITDCDEAIAFGTYNILPETKNAPTADYYHLVVEPAANGTWIKQTAVLSDATAPLINSFTRININGEWSEWTSSCVNADTVDGFHANEIASSPNLIVNPNFKVNQKGLTSFSSNGYTVDHWRMYKHSSVSTYGTVSVIDNGIHVVSGGTKLDTHLQQYIENWKELEGKTVTLSFEIDNLVGSLSVCQMGNTVSNITTNGVHAMTFNWGSGQSNNSILFYNSNVAQISYDLKWVKLELGSIATPFVPPNFATELLRIQAMDGTISADTVDGKHASDFSQIISFGDTPTDTKTAIGIQGKTTTYWCSHWTDYPAGLLDGQGVIIAVNYKGSGTTGTDNLWCRQFFFSPSGNATRVFQRIISGTNVGSWINIADGGNASTAKTASTLATTSSNICLRNLSSGTAEATWNTATMTGNCPVGAWYGKHS